MENQPHPDTMTILRDAMTVLKRGDLSQRSELIKAASKISTTNIIDL